MGELEPQLEAWLLATRGSPLLLASIAVSIVVVLVAILCWRSARHQRGPRTLSRQKKAALVAAIDGTCTSSFPVSCRTEDGEAKAYAEDFVEALRRGGCDAILHDESRLRPDAAGVYVVIVRRKSIPGAETLAQAMRAAQIEFKVAFDSDVVPEQLAGPDGFALIVGRVGP